MPTLTPSLNRLLAHLLISMSLCGYPVVSTQAASAPIIQPESGPWDAGAGFLFDLGKKKALKTRQSVSGVACNLNAKQQRVCLLVFDEGTQARYAYPTDGQIKVDPEPLVFAGVSGELDAEAAATDGRDFYVTGSHSAKRSNCASNPDSRHVFRLHIDPTTGRAVQTGAAETGRLWQLMLAQPDLQPYVGERKCLGTEPPPKAPKLAGQQGINIEGLAAQGGRLYFGFRGPVLEATAMVLSVNAQALFQSTDAQPVLTKLALGEHRGIRDMVAVSDGLLLLAGPDDDAASKRVDWAVFWWDTHAAPSGQALVVPKHLATLDLSQVKLQPCDETLKPEAVTVLEETARAYKLLVLSDGLCDGGPMVFSVPR